MSQSSGLIGDVSQLRSNRVVVPVTVEVTGNSRAFHIKLRDSDDVAHYRDNFASVRIDGGITVEVSGATSPTVATCAVVAICPDKYDDWPTTALQVKRLEGSTVVQQSLLVPIDIKPGTPGRETSDILKPDTLIDYPPVVVGFLTVAGGTANSVSLVTIHTPLLLDGVAHRKTW